MGMRVWMKLWLAIKVLFFGLVPVAAFATGKSAGFGGVATNLMAPVGLFSSCIQNGCFVIGSAFLLASIVKYREHKNSPLMVPISTVVFLLLEGAFLIGLPFLSYAMPNGGPLAT